MTTHRASLKGLDSEYNIAWHQTRLLLLTGQTDKLWRETVDFAWHLPNAVFDMFRNTVHSDFLCSNSAVVQSDTHGDLEKLAKGRVGVADLEIPFVGVEISARYRPMAARWLHMMSSPDSWLGDAKRRRALWLILMHQQRVMYEWLSAVKLHWSWDVGSS